MSRTFRTRFAAVGVAVAFCAAAALADNTVRPEVGKPLKAAEALMKSGKARDALAKIGEAEAVPNRTPYENLLIQEMRGSAANAAGDLAGANKAFEGVIASGQIPARDQLTLVQAVAVNYYRLKEYDKAATWTQRYFKEGGTDGAMRTVLLQSYYLGGDCGSVTKLVGGADESRKPAEEELEILRSCYRKDRDDAGYVAATEKLITYYPKKDYWTDLLGRVQRKPGFSDRLSVNVYRLRFATGNLTTVNDYMEFAQLALQAGLPAEAKTILDKGYEVGLLGKGDQAPRQQRLRDLIAKSLADSQKARAQDEREATAAAGGDDLVRLGLETVYEGNAEKGLALIQQGIKKGNLKHPEDAKLALGEAQIAGGQKQRAVQTLRSVEGKDGTADLARLWILEARG